MWFRSSVSFTSRNVSLLSSTQTAARRGKIVSFPYFPVITRNSSSSAHKTNGLSAIRPKT
eukprot:UN03953